MKVVLLAGGRGTRLAEETEVRPKPLVEVGGMPILWHIMKIYSQYGFNDFLVALGYKGSLIKRFFLDYGASTSNVTIDFSTREVQLDHQIREPWRVSLIDTGLEANTGGRVLALRDQLGGGPFMVTYGDGLADVDISALVAFHRRHGRLATVTAVRPPARFGGLLFDGDYVAQFTEKPQAGEGWINGGFLVFEQGVFEYLQGAESSLEVDLLERLAADNQLAAYKHPNFWQCMDTLRDKQLLERLWSSEPPWKVWK